MKKVAIFGKPGGGKSTLGKQLSLATGIPYYALDLLEYLPSGERVAQDVYLQKHTELIARDTWIIDGLGKLSCFWERIDAADTLIYIDLPFSLHYWFTIKRLFKSLWSKPEGWPEGSSVFKGTLASWQYLRLSPQFWTSELFKSIQIRAEGKTIHHITSGKALTSFVKDNT